MQTIKIRIKPPKISVLLLAMLRREKGKKTMQEPIYLDEWLKLPEEERARYYYEEWQDSCSYDIQVIDLKTTQEQGHTCDTCGGIGEIMIGTTDSREPYFCLECFKVADEGKGVFFLYE